MKKHLYILFLFSICYGQIRSLNGSLSNSQRIIWDTTSSRNTFTITTSNGVHTLWFPYSRFALTGSGSVGNADSLGSHPASDYARLSISNTYSAGTTQSMDTANISNGKIFNRVSIRNGQNIQSILDSYTERSVSLYILGTVTQNSTIYFGNSTLFQGEVSNLLTQSTQTYYPRGVFDFSGSAIDGFSNTDTSWRAQKATFRDISIKGSGYNNGKVGFRFINSDSGTAGLAEINNVYIQNFQTGINTSGTSDSHNYKDLHFQIFNIGIDSVNQQTRIDGCDLWNSYAVGANHSIGIRLTGTNNVVTRGEFEIGTGDAGVDTFGVSLITTPVSYSNIISNNRFQHAVNFYVADSGKRNVIVGNIFQPYSTSITSYAVLAGSQSTFTANSINHGGSDSSHQFGNAIVVGGSDNIISSNAIHSIKKYGYYGIYISGSSNTIIGNSFLDCSGSSGNVFVNSGATGNILIGDFPNGITDNGTRTIINGKSKNIGDPNTSGQWNGQSALAYRAGAVIENTSTNPSQFFRSDSVGNWVRTDGYWTRSSGGVLTPSTGTDTLGAMVLNTAFTIKNTTLNPNFIVIKNKDGSNRVVVDSSANGTFIGASPLWSFTSTNNSSGARWNTTATATTSHRFQYNGTTFFQVGVASLSASQSFGTFTIKPSASTPTKTLLTVQPSSSSTPVFNADSLGITTTGTNMGSAVIGVGDSVQVSISGMTTATGMVVVAYRNKGATTFDTSATWDVNTADKITLYGKYNKTVSYWIGSK